MPNPWIAVVNWGRWLARCPRECGSAEGLDPGQKSAVCVECGYGATVDWPGNAAAITAALQKRPIPKDRNWAPKGHPQNEESLTPDGTVVAHAYPKGQTVADLTHETAAIAEGRAAQPSKADQAAAALAALGLQFDATTGTVKGL